MVRHNHYLKNLKKLSYLIQLCIILRFDNKRIIVHESNSEMYYIVRKIRSSSNLASANGGSMTSFVYIFQKATLQ